MKVIIMSGVAGAGKTTWLRLNVPTVYVEGNIVSANSFFMTKRGYEFDPKMLPEAHAACLKTYVDLLYHSDGTDIAVDNTACSIVELAPYVALADAYGADYEIVTIECDPEVAFKRNIHGVPRATVMRMAGNLKKRLLSDMPRFWNHRIIQGG